MVETSFSHEGVGAGTLAVSYDVASSRLKGISENGNISFNPSEAGQTISEALSYAVTFDHEGHVDRGFCQGLEIYEHDHDEDDHDHSH